MVKDIKIVCSDPYYFQGSVVNGKVLVSVDKPKDYKKITVELFGFARTRWSESTGNGRTRVYQRTIEYVERKYILWSKERAPTGNLPVGEHSFPFSMQLPNEGPPSFYSSTGQVTYRVTARIAQDKKLKFGHHVEVLLNVMSRIPTVCMQPKEYDLDSNVKFCCCFNFGPVHISCNLPRTGFVLGENIPLNIQVENLSNKSVYIRACISKKEVYHAGGSSRRYFNRNLSVLRLQDVPVGIQTGLEEASLTIPSTLSVSIDHCPIIEVRYFVVIQAIRSLGSSERMKIPIVIANAPSIQTNTAF